jgi:hypothetical protein
VGQQQPEDLGLVADDAAMQHIHATGVEDAEVRVGDQLACASEIAAANCGLERRVSTAVQAVGVSTCL